MKKMLILSLAVLLAMVMLISGCSNAPAPQSGGSQQQSEAQATEAQSENQGDNQGEEEASFADMTAEEAVAAFNAQVSGKNPKVEFETTAETEDTEEGKAYFFAQKETVAEVEKEGLTLVYGSDGKLISAKVGGFYKTELYDTDEGIVTALKNRTEFAARTLCCMIDPGLEDLDAVMMMNEVSKMTINADTGLNESSVEKDAFTISQAATPIPVPDGVLDGQKIITITVK